MKNPVATSRWNFVGELTPADHPRIKEAIAYKCRVWPQHDVLVFVPPGKGACPDRVQVRFLNAYLKEIGPTLLITEMRPINYWEIIVIERGIVSQVKPLGYWGGSTFSLCVRHLCNSLLRLVCKGRDLWLVKEIESQEVLDFVQEAMRAKVNVNPARQDAMG
jgi:hypothetical protein